MATVELGAGIQPLSPEEAARLNVSRWSTTSSRRLVEIVRAYPRRSVWQPSTREYAIVAQWRHRPEIAQLFELSAQRDPLGLASAAVAAAHAHGAELFVAVETGTARRPAFYERLGMTLMEEVISLEHPAPKVLASRGGDDVELLRDLDPETVGQLRAVDHAAFPWLWHNSDAEFRAYAGEPGVELHAIRGDGRIRGYIGVTAYLGWGHIDRVAVDPALQGRGLGGRLTRVGIDRLVRLGARRVGLSTQTTNLPARRMYEKLGFTRQLATDYRLYGRWLTDRRDAIDPDP